MLKKLFFCITCICIFIAICVPVALAGHTPPSNSNNELIEPKKEETNWEFAVIDGALHKRLWSITYGKWLTEWIRV